MRSAPNKAFFVLNIFGITALAIGWLAATVVGFYLFIHPDPRFLPAPVDLIWITIYAGGILLVGLAAFFHKGSWLFYGVLCASIILILTPFLRGYAIDLFLLAWLIFAAICAGDCLVRWLRLGGYLTSGERFVLGAAVGFSLLMVIGLALGLLHLFYSWIIYAIVILLTVGFAPSFVKSTFLRGPSAPTALKAKREILGLVGAIILLSVFSTFFWALAPSIRYDAATYHLAAPAIYIQNHAIVEIPESYQTYWAHYVETLYTFTLLLRNGPLPSLLHFCMFLLSTGLTFAIGARVSGRRTALLGMLLFVTLPILGFEAGTAYIDLFVTFFVGAFFLSFLIWQQTEAPGFLFISGILAGIAIGSKLNSLPIIIPVLVWITIRVFRKNRFSQKAFFSLLLVFMPVLILWLPWLVRDYLWTGNPIFPTYNSIFHSAKWFETDLFALRSVGAGWLPYFLKFPWDMLVNSQFYYHEAPGGMFAALPVLFLPWLYAWHPTIPPHVRKNASALFLSSLLAIVFLVSSAGGGRYFMPLFPVWAILAALNLETVIKICSNVQQKRLLSGTLLVLGLTYFFSTRLSLLIRFIELPERFPVQVWLGLEKPTEFLSNNLRIYPALQFLNQQGDGNHKVFSVGNELRLYTTSRIYGPLFSKEAYDILHYSTTPDQLAAALTQNGYDYIIIYPPEIQFRPQVYQAPVLGDQFLKRFTHLVYIQDWVSVYRFYPQGVEPSSEVLNLLSNSGFEAISTDNEVASWVSLGQKPLIETSAPVHSGVKSVGLEGPSISALYQDVAVTAGNIYTLGQWVTPDETGQKLQIHIDWFSETGKIISSSVDWQVMDSGWHDYTFQGMAPAGAVNARIYLSVASHGLAWFDDLCFAQGDSCP